jgi:hypothetical protein
VLGEILGEMVTDQSLRLGTTIKFYPFSVLARSQRLGTMVVQLSFNHGPF